jgi:hypothetical protein
MLYRAFQLAVEMPGSDVRLFLFDHLEGGGGAVPGTSTEQPSWELLQPGRHADHGLPQTTMHNASKQSEQQYRRPQGGRTACLRRCQAVSRQNCRQVIKVSAATNLISFSTICQRLKAAVGSSRLSSNVTLNVNLIFIRCNSI